MAMTMPSISRAAAEVVGALSAALDWIDTPVEINHTRSRFRLTLDLSKVPEAFSHPGEVEYTDRYGRKRMRKYHPTAAEKHAALPAEMRYRQAIVRLQKLVEKSPRKIWG